MRRDEAPAPTPSAGGAFRRPCSDPAPRPAGFVLYSRRYCHLCDEMLAALQAQLGMETPITVVDVDSDPALEASYGDQVPVLMFAQAEVCRHRHDAGKVAAYIAQSR